MGHMRIASGLTKSAEHPSTLYSLVCLGVSSMGACSGCDIENRRLGDRLVPLVGVLWPVFDRVYICRLVGSPGASRDWIPIDSDSYAPPDNNRCRHVGVPFQF